MAHMCLTSTSVDNPKLTGREFPEKEYCFTTFCIFPLLTKATTMNRISLLCTALCLVFNSFAISKPVKPVPLKATEIYLPIGKNGERISLMDLSVIKVRDLEDFTGKKMRFFDKIGFKLSQKKLRSSIRPDGNFNSKRFTKALKRGGETGFHFGGFALGFFLGLVGVLIAYLIKDDYKPNRVKWAWLGLGIFLVIYLLLVLALL
jgi:hypothetical protein